MSAQIIQALEKIEAKFHNFTTDQRVISERLLLLEQKRDALAGEYNTKAGGLGEQFIKQFDANRELFEKTRSVRLEIKAAGDAITTTNGRNIISGGVGAPMGNVLGLQNALTIRPASGTSAVEYSRYTGQQGAAAVQSAEGAAKAAVRPDHTLITQTALTVAGFAKMSRQAMSDSAELKRAVDTTLNRSVNTALDVALTTGGAGFTGGFAALATASTSLTYTSLVDAVAEGVSTMQTAGFNPDVVAVSPADWLAVVVAKGSDAHYLSGNYLGAMPSAMRGLRVVLSPTVAAGKALLLDSAHAELLVVDAFTIEVAYSGDDFTNNLVTVLGEMRVIPIFRTTGSMRLITPKA
ncbi:hypothetical protein EGT07_10205 [Herbaspirillum sp. HC18]|nr:hypothetical protein EGT07_10205 [Herbaspirillum sp. HC18]